MVVRHSYLNVMLSLDGCEIGKSLTSTLFIGYVPQFVRVWSFKWVKACAAKCSTLFSVTRTFSAITYDFTWYKFQILDFQENSRMKFERAVCSWVKSYILVCSKSNHSIDTPKLHIIVISRDWLREIVFFISNLNHFFYIYSVLYLLSGISLL